MATLDAKEAQYKWEDARTLLHVPTDTHFTILNGSIHSYELDRPGRQLDNGDEFWPSDVVAMAQKIAADG